MGSQNATNPVVCLSVGPFYYFLFVTDQGQFVVPVVDDKNLRVMSAEEIIGVWIDSRDHQFEPGSYGYYIDFKF